MKKVRPLILASTLVALAACTRSAEWNDSLEDFLQSQPNRFGDVLKEPEKHRVQVIYTQVDRDEHNRPSFRSYSYRVNEDEYFYPASTVKLPTALLALEKINTIGSADLTRDTAMLTAAVGDSQSVVFTDPSSRSGLPSIGHYIRKILLVSDNDAFNRLYEFLGQQPLNESMHGKGFTDTRIMHRLEVTLSIDENRNTNPVVFIGGDNVVYEQAAAVSDTLYTAGAPILLGRAEIIGGDRLERPKDFAEKNAYPLQEQHDVIRALMFPDSVPGERRFGLTDSDYQFVYRNMSTYPGDSGIPEYEDAGKYPDGYVKFLMYGGDAAHIPDNIRIFNKVGDAYGFLTDAAYIIDLQNQVEFILAATVYTNANETFNDNNYEYAEIGLPFLRELGQAIYEVELARERQFLPDLSRFDFSEEGANHEQKTE